MRKAVAAMPRKLGVLSVILALVLAFGFASFAFAEDEAVDAGAEGASSAGSSASVEPPAPGVAAS